MSMFNTPATSWFLLGFILFLLEFIIPGLVLFFFGVGAWITALVVLAFALPLNAQLVLFLISSVLTLALFRKSIKKLTWSRKLERNEVLEDEFIGKTAVAQTDIAPGQTGKVEFKGTNWEARTTDMISKGDKVLISGTESITLIVNSIKA
jgi:membrane protein implicated in regulation of membrane protease activity